MLAPALKRYMVNLLIVLGILGSFVSFPWFFITVVDLCKYGWNRYDIKEAIKGAVSLAIFGNMLGWSIWYDQTYIRPTIDNSFQVEIKNVPKGYRFEGYLVNRDTGERKNVIEKAE